MPNDLSSGLSENSQAALHFGAGKIGRGFIGPLLSDAGYHVVFADVDDHVIELLNSAHHYSLEVLSEKHTTHIVRQVGGIVSTSPDVIDLLAHPGAVQLLTTSVGASILPRLAPTIAQGLEKRMQANGAHLNVIACENLLGGTALLAAAVMNELADNPDVVAWCSKNVGWANCAVDRIVPPFETPPGASELDVGVEPFYEWTVDETQLKGQVSIKGMKLVDNLEAYIERKLFTLNCGHAAFAYLGFLRGYATIDETMEDSEIQDIVVQAVHESGRALIKKHDFDPAKHGAYIDTMLHRFRNPALKDDVKRIGAGPLRKLGPNDRLVGPTNMLREFNFPRDHLLIAIAAALHFNVPEDNESVELQQKIKEHGLENTLRDVCGWQLSNPGEAADIEEVVKQYHALNEWRSKPKN